MWIMMLMMMMMMMWMMRMMMMSQDDVASMISSDLKVTIYFFVRSSGCRWVDFDKIARHA
jgi:hypothetical protein